MLNRVLIFILLMFLHNQLFANKLLGQLREVVSDFKDKSFVVNSSIGMGLLFSTVDNKTYTMQAGIASRGIFKYTHVIVSFDKDARQVVLPIQNLEVRRLTGAKDISDRTSKEKNMYGLDNEYYLFANIDIKEDFIKLFFEYNRFNFYFYDDYEKYKSPIFNINNSQNLSMINTCLIKLLTEDVIVFE